MDTRIGVNTDTRFLDTDMLNLYVTEDRDVDSVNHYRVYANGELMSERGFSLLELMKAKTYPPFEWITKETNRIKDVADYLQAFYAA